MRRLVTAVSALLLIATLAPSAGAQDIRSGSDGKPGDPSMRPPSSRPRLPFRRGFIPCCVAYFPLEITLFNWLHGSNVTGYINSVASNSYPDLAGIGVKQ